MSTLHLPLPRVGLIGVSGYAAIYVDLLRAAHDAGRIRLAAAAVLQGDLDHPSVAWLRQSGARVFTDLADMLEAMRGGLDLCMIPTGIHWHKRMTIAALEAGAHVLVEKPLAGCVADGEAILTSERRNGRWVAVGFQDIYSPETRTLQRQLAEGAIGRLRSAKIIGLWPRPSDYYRRNNWAGRLRVEGVETRDSPLNNALAHFVNLGLYLAGPQPDQPAEARVTEAELLRANDIESFDTAVVRAISPEGVAFWFGVSHATLELRHPEIHIEGDSGNLIWHQTGGYTLTVNGSPAVTRPVPDYPETRQAMFDAVLERIHDPATFICSASMAMNHLRFIESVHASGEILTFPRTSIRRTGPDHPTPGVPAVRGLAARMDRAFEAGCLLRELKEPITR